MPRKRKQPYKYKHEPRKTGTQFGEHKWKPCVSCGFKRAGRLRIRITNLFPGWALCSVCYDWTDKQLLKNIDKQEKQTVKKKNAARKK